MKTVKHFSILAVFLSLLLLVSCSQTTLGAPDKVTVENGSLHWNSVNGARSYAIAVDGLEKAQTTNNHYSLDSLGLEAGVEYQLQVKALGDGYLYMNSDFSASVTVTYQPTDNGGGQNGGTQGGGNQSGGTAASIPIQETEENVFYKAHPNASPILKDSFSDGRFYYYYYHLGYFENFPLVYSSTKEFTQSMKDEGIRPAFSETIAAESQSSIEETVSNSITETDGGGTAWEEGFEFEIGGEGLILSAGGKGMTSVTDNWTWENSNTYSTAHSVASSWVTSFSRTVSFEFTDNTNVGYYRYVQYTKKCDVFALVVYDTTTKKFSWEYISYADESIKSMVDVFEYSNDSIFPSDELGDKLEFDKSHLSSIDVNLAPEYKGPVVNTPISPIAIPVNRVNCDDGNGYDPSKQESDRGWTKAHDHFEVGQLVMYGAKKEENGYTVADSKSFALRFRLDINPENLPKNSDKHNMKISIDDCSSLYDNKITSKIGQGAYWVRITYNDGTLQQSIVQTNFMHGKTQGDFVGLVENGNLRGSASAISKIEVTVVYEVFVDTGFFVTYQHTNWRCDYVFIFE